MDSGGDNDPRRRPAASRLEGQVIRHKSGFLLIQEATTFRRDKGGRCELADNLSPGIGNLSEITILTSSSVMVTLIKY